MHHATKEVQFLEIKNEVVFEKFNITIKNGNGGNFQVRFVNPLYDSTVTGSVRLWTSGLIKDNETNRWIVRQQLVDYFNTIWGSNIEVFVRTTDDNFNDVAASVATQRVFQVRVVRNIAQKSYSTASIVLATGTTSTIAIAEISQSTPPIAGNFQIACKNKDGVEFTTREIGINWGITWINLLVFWDIPHLQLKVNMRDTPKYEYRYNGVQLQLEFTDLHEKPSLCTIKSGTTTPISGGSATVPLKYESSVVREYGKNLMFEPVPLEMLYHNA